MFGIDSTEFLVIVIIAVIVIGPKDLPRALYKVGQIVGKAQGMARHFRTGLDAMVREVELEELEKKWAAQTKRIMDEHPADPADAAATPLPAPDAAAEAPADHPPFVAQSAPQLDVPEAAPVPPAASDKPPYLAEAPVSPSKGDAAA